jgi:hypothetical protein
MAPWQHQTMERTSTATFFVLTECLFFSMVTSTCSDDDKETHHLEISDKEDQQYDKTAQSRSTSRVGWATGSITVRKNKLSSDFGCVQEVLVAVVGLCSVTAMSVVGWRPCTGLMPRCTCSSVPCGCPALLICSSLPNGSLLLPT